MTNLSVLIPAAGRGSRSGLTYPKTLYPVNGVPILHRLLKKLYRYDANPTVVVSPHGVSPINHSLSKAGLPAQLIVQESPTGMGDAVLLFDRPDLPAIANNILLVWGDLVGLQSSTIEKLVSLHFEDKNDFSFATSIVSSPYTIVQRDLHGKVLSVAETRDQTDNVPSCGERDIGLFIFRKEPVFDILRYHQNLFNAIPSLEHGFLYVVGHLVERSFSVKGYPIATHQDIISLNSISDLRGYLG